MDPDKWDYVVSFWAVSHGCMLAFERSGDGFGEGTEDIIRLIGPCMILNKGESQ